MRQITKIVLHTAGAVNPKTGRAVYQTRDDIDRYHREHNGWRMIGYHFYIEEDGAVKVGRREDEVGAHVQGFNEHTIGVCVAGAGDVLPFNAKQTAALMTLLARLTRTYRLTSDDTIGHRECPAHGSPPVHKTCPGMLIDMDDVRQRLADRLETSA
jgi:N-acetyl-anhydromuramyl-L-alanine amidase AmpD